MGQESCFNVCVVEHTVTVTLSVLSSQWYRFGLLSSIGAQVSVHEDNDQHPSNNAFMKDQEPKTIIRLVAGCSDRHSLHGCSHFADCLKQCWGWWMGR